MTHRNGQRGQQQQQVLPWGGPVLRGALKRICTAHMAAGGGGGGGSAASAAVAAGSPGTEAMQLLPDLLLCCAMLEASSATVPPSAAAGGTASGAAASKPYKQKRRTDSAAGGGGFTLGQGPMEPQPAAVARELAAAVEADVLLPALLQPPELLQPLANACLLAMLQLGLVDAHLQRARAHVSARVWRNLHLQPRAPATAPAAAVASHHVQDAYGGQQVYSEFTDLNNGSIGNSSSWQDDAGVAGATAMELEGGPGCYTQFGELDGSSWHSGQANPDEQGGCGGVGLPLLGELLQHAREVADLRGAGGSGGGSSSDVQPAAMALLPAAPHLLLLLPLHDLGRQQHHQQQTRWRAPPGNGVGLGAFRAQHDNGSGRTAGAAVLQEVVGPVCSDEQLLAALDGAIRDSSLGRSDGVA